MRLCVEPAIRTPMALRCLVAALAALSQFPPLFGALKNISRKIAARWKIPPSDLPYIIGGMLPSSADCQSAVSRIANPQAVENRSRHGIEPKPHHFFENI